MAADSVFGFLSAEPVPVEPLGAVAALAPDGLGAVLVSPAGRLRAVARVRRAGLEPIADLVPLPPRATPQRLAARDPDVLARALARRVPRGVPGVATLAAALPGALLVRRAGSRARTVLAELVPEADPGRFLISRTPAAEAVAFVWGRDGADPVAFLKRGAVGREAAALDRLGPTARAAGARVARVLRREGPWMVTDVLSGDPLSEVLHARPAELPRAIDAVCAWTGSWLAATAVERPATADDVEARLLAPARRLAGRLPADAEQRLGEAFAGLPGTPMPWAPAHRDLTMANVLDGTPIGVVDWARPQDEAPPLMDLPYALADAVAACDGYADRPAAFERAYGDPGAAPRGALAAAGAATGAPALALSFAFCACWLEHADDERAAGQDGPFARIAATVLADRLRVDPFARG